MISLLLFMFSSANGAPMVPKKTIVIQSAAQGEEMQENRGFGDKAGEIKMMNLMMVGGSGYEGMDMAQTTPTTDVAGTSAADHSHHAESLYSIEMNPVDAKMGNNLINFIVTDPKTTKPKSGLKLKSEVYMTNMDMGTETPKVKDLGLGKYQVKANFSMRGPWAIKISIDQTTKEFRLQAK